MLVSGILNRFSKRESEDQAALGSSSILENRREYRGCALTNFLVDLHENPRIGSLMGDFRASRIPTRRHRRNENTWREGKRQNTPRPPTRARAAKRADTLARSLSLSLSLSLVYTHTHTHARPRFLWSDQ